MKTNINRVWTSLKEEEKLAVYRDMTDALQ